MTSTAEPEAPGTGRWALPCAIAAAAWIGASLGPWGLPAWPSVSLGAVALWLSRCRGPVVPRAIGAFVGLIALVLGIGKIAALWGLAEAVRH